MCNAFGRVLETDGQKLGCNSVGVSVTTLEEVFLRVAREGDGSTESNEGSIRAGMKENDKANHEMIRRLSDQRRSSEAVKIVIWQVMHFTISGFFVRFLGKFVARRLKSFLD
jgi:hypothetical protein